MSTKNSQQSRANGMQRSTPKRRRNSKQRALLAQMNEILNRRSYIRNLVASVQKELASLAAAFQRLREKHGTHGRNRSRHHIQPDCVSWIRKRARRSVSRARTVQLCALPIVSVDTDGKIFVGEPARQRLLTQSRPHNLFRETPHGPWRCRHSGRTRAFPVPHR